jgi:hypothetical protein
MLNAKCENPTLETVLRIAAAIETDFAQRAVRRRRNLLAILNSQSSILQSFTWGQDLSGTMDEAGGIGGLLFVGNFASPVGHYAAVYDGKPRSLRYGCSASSLFSSKSRGALMTPLS